MIYDYADVQDYHSEIERLGGRIFVVPNPKKNIFKYLIEVNKLLKKNLFYSSQSGLFWRGINLWLAKRMESDRELLIAMQLKMENLKIL